MMKPFRNNKTLPSLICELELGIQDLPFPLSAQQLMPWVVFCFRACLVRSRSVNVFFFSF